MKLDSFSIVYSIAKMVDDYEQIVSPLYLHHYHLSNWLFQPHWFSIKQRNQCEIHHLLSVYLKFIHTRIKIRRFFFATKIIVFMFLQASQHLNQFDHFPMVFNEHDRLRYSSVDHKCILKISISRSREEEGSRKRYQMLLFHFHERNHVISRVMLDEIEID